MSSPENSIYTVLNATVLAAGNDKELKDSEVHPTAYNRIRTKKAIRVGNCESDFAPYVENTIKELDGDLVLQILSKVEDEEDAETYPPARDSVRQMTIEIIQSLLDNRSLSGAGCDLKFKRAFRGWTRIETMVYAVSLLPVCINPTGKYE